ncbi:TIGR03617 family F420-dependent LLM class oxidoreductase [Mycobacterium sp. NPDC050441]|uniref:TIGR03617 family F420-dependent LLM class oxidoreductase n=1 Tax=Mycobacterium sp. NPDC050441 TaxID=3155403 RepID=UPI0033D48FD7
MKVYLALDPREPLTVTADYARRVERLGCDGLHVAETVHDSLAVSLLALANTSRITVRTAVTLAFVRSPTLTAYTAWDLSVLSGGRFELGLGTQIKQNIEDRYGMPWSDPIARLRDYVGALDALFDAFRTGGTVHFESQNYRLTRMQPYFNPGPSDAVRPPIWLGAVNAGMCELAGGVARGIVTHSTNSGPDYLRDIVRPALGRGADAAGRAESPLIIASTSIATGSTDEAVDRERERQRRMLAFLYSTPAYATGLARRGLAELPERLRSLVRTELWDELPSVLTDSILDELVVCGRHDELPMMLKARFGDVADGIVLPPLGDGDDDESLGACVAQLRAVD